MRPTLVQGEHEVVTTCAYGNDFTVKFKTTIGNGMVVTEDYGIYEKGAWQCKGFAKFDGLRQRVEEQVVQTLFKQQQNRNRQHSVAGIMVVFGD